MLSPACIQPVLQHQCPSRAKTLRIQLWGVCRSSVIFNIQGKGPLPATAAMGRESVLCCLLVCTAPSHKLKGLQGLKALTLT